MLIWFAFCIFCICFFSDAQVIQWARPNHHIFKVASSAEISGSADRRIPGMASRTIHDSLRLGDSMQRQVRGHCDHCDSGAVFERLDMIRDTDGHNSQALYWDSTDHCTGALAACCSETICNIMQCVNKSLGQFLSNQADQTHTYI